MNKTYNISRDHMVKNQLMQRGIVDQHVLKTMRVVPRHLFIDPSLADQSYEDHPITIGEGQTISQPYMVALMTQSLNLTPDKTVLEIGTGSGYQTAILAELSKSVYTIESIDILSKRACNVLTQQGYRNIHFLTGDGTKGWPHDNLTFDAIIVTAAAPNRIDPLLNQLNENGRMVIPVGDKYTQLLKQYSKIHNRIIEEDLCSCVFVPLVGEYGWKI